MFDFIKKYPKISIFGFVVGILFGIVLILSFSIIGAGERGVLLRFGAVQDEILGEGFHFVSPIVQKVVIIDVKTQKVDVDAPSFSKDLQSVETKIALNYHLEPGQVNKLWQEIGRDFESRIISPAIQESVKAATAKFTAAEMVSERPRVKEEIRMMLAKRLENRYIHVDDFSIVNFEFSEAYEKSIEDKQVAQQNAFKAENDLRRIEIEASQKIASAKAEAESLRIQAEALQQNQKLVDLEAIRRWDGKLPVTMFGNSMPFVSVPSTGK